MKYLSVCSGIEAATQAWHPLGWEPVAFSEIERFPAAVLAHRYPHVPNWGDMTKFEEWPDADVDVLAGGTPCQSFSVGGLRKGLADPRGSLMLTYLAIAAKYRPRWIVWENVVGVLSSNGGRDFGTFLGGLGEIGYGFAYRVLDAQYFGLAQQRPRVFVVGHIDWMRAAAVLFEPESLSRRAEARPAPDVSVCITRRGPGSLDDRETYVVEGGRARHMTPVEVERVMGFPDDFTRIPWRGKSAENCPDGPRYKALGNSWAVNVAAWIGERIAILESLNDQGPTCRAGP